METPPVLLQSIFFIVISGILVALNAFFVAAEFAIVKVRRTRLEELIGQGYQKARISLLLVDSLDEYLSATQLGITLVSLALGWIGEEGFYNFLVYFFPSLGAGHGGVLHFTAAIGSFFIITMLHVVLGELVPKSLAIQRAERVVLVVSKPLHFFFRMAKPLIVAFTRLSNAFLRMLGLHGLEDSPMTEEELKLILEESHEEGVISKSEAQLIKRAFEFSDKLARDILVPLSRVHYISLSRSFDANLRISQERMFTRYPLTRDKEDSIIGIVLMKDALHAMHDRSTNEVFTKTARRAVFVAPDLRQDEMLELMRKKHTHMLVVQDPHTKMNLGIVTLEDILAHLFGDIQDEHGN